MDTWPAFHNMDDSIVENWLRSLDLTHYTQAFLDNGYDDLEVCKQIGDADLDAIGVLRPDHRALILQQVAKLREQGGVTVYFILEEPIYEDALPDEEGYDPGDQPDPGGAGAGAGAFAADGYVEGQKALVTFPKLQLTSIIRDRLAEDADADGGPLPQAQQDISDEAQLKLCNLATKYSSELNTHYGDVLYSLCEAMGLRNTPDQQPASNAQDTSGVPWGSFGMFSAYGPTSRSAPPPLPSCPPPSSNYADIGRVSPELGSSPDHSRKSSTLSHPGSQTAEDDGSIGTVSGSPEGEKRKGSTLGRFFKNVTLRRSGKKYVYRQHEGDLNAYEITMADEERIELMLQVKEGRISMEEAVEKVKEYEKQKQLARAQQLQDYQALDDRHTSPKLSFLRRKSSDSRHGKESSSTESSPRPSVKDYPCDSSSQISLEEESVLGLSSARDYVNDGSQSQSSTSLSQTSEVEAHLDQPESKESVSPKHWFKKKSNQSPKLGKTATCCVSPKRSRKSGRGSDSDVLSQEDIPQPKPPSKTSIFTSPFTRRKCIQAVKSHQPSLSPKVKRHIGNGEGNYCNIGDTKIQESNGIPGSKTLRYSHSKSKSSFSSTPYSTEPRKKERNNKDKQQCSGSKIPSLTKSKRDSPSESASRLPIKSSSHKKLSTFSPNQSSLPSKTQGKISVPTKQHSTSTYASISKTTENVTKITNGAAKRVCDTKEPRIPHSDWTKKGSKSPDRSSSGSVKSLQGRSSNSPCAARSPSSPARSSGSSQSSHSKQALLGDPSPSQDLGEVNQQSPGSDYNFYREHPLGAYAENLLREAESETTLQVEIYETPGATVEYKSVLKDNNTNAIHETRAVVRNTDDNKTCKDDQFDAQNFYENALNDQQVVPPGSSDPDDMEEGRSRKKREKSSSRRSSVCTSGDENLSSDYEDQDNGDLRSSGMFGRNSAARSSLSDKVKVLGRDVKRRIARLKANRPEKDGESASSPGSPGSEPSSLVPEYTCPVQDSIPLSPPSPPKCVYNGPFVGRAKVIRDYTPSPYDKEALVLKYGQVVKIISTSDTGIWRGMINNKVGTFKFVHVEMLPAESPRHTPQRARRPRPQKRGKPKSVEDLLTRLGLQHLVTVFLLHDYDTLETFSEVEQEDLEDLRILDPEDRAKILTAAQLLRDYESLDFQDSPHSPSPSRASQTSEASGCVDASQLDSRLRFGDRPHVAGVAGHRDSGCYASIETLPPTDSSGKTSSVESGREGSPLTAKEQTIPCGNVDSQSEDCCKSKDEIMVNGVKDMPGTELPECDDMGEQETLSGQTLTTAKTSLQVLQVEQPANQSRSCSPSPNHSPRMRKDKQDSCCQTNGQVQHSGQSSGSCATDGIQSQGTSPGLLVPKNGRPVMRWAPTCVRDAQCGDLYSNGVEIVGVGEAMDCSPKRRAKPPPPVRTVSGSTSPHLGSPIRGQSPVRTVQGSPVYGPSPSSSPKRSPIGVAPGSLARSPMGSPQRTGGNKAPPPLPKRVKPKVPERTSSLHSSSANSSPTHQPTGRQPSYAMQNGPVAVNASLVLTRRKASTLGRLTGPCQSPLHIRRLSAPGTRTFEDALVSSAGLFTPPGSPYKSRLPLAQCFPSSFSDPKFVSRHESLISKRRPRPISISLEAMVVAKLADEGINLTEPPYTDQCGFCGIPPALVQRYADELKKDIVDIAIVMDECRIRHLQDIGRAAVPNDFLGDSCLAAQQEYLVSTATLPDFLTSIGLPMYADTLSRHGINNIETLRNLQDYEWKKMGVNNPNHANRLEKALEILLMRLAMQEKQKQAARLAKKSRIRDKV